MALVIAVTSIGATSAPPRQAQRDLSAAVRAEAKADVWRHRYVRMKHYARRQEIIRGKAEARVRRLVAELSKLRGRRVTRPSTSVPAWFLSDILCIHRYESSDWYYGAPGHRGGNGFEGGLQFLQSTWLSNGGGRYAQHAYLASPSEQIAVAWNLYRHSGWTPWPNTSRYCGLA